MKTQIKEGSGTKPLREKSETFREKREVISLRPGAEIIGTKICLAPSFLASREQE